jgi:hypothetical protein
MEPILLLHFIQPCHNAYPTVNEYITEDPAKHSRH